MQQSWQSPRPWRSLDRARSPSAHESTYPRERGFRIDARLRSEHRAAEDMENHCLLILVEASSPGGPAAPKSSRDRPARLSAFSPDRVSGCVSTGRRGGTSSMLRADALPNSFDREGGSTLSVLPTISKVPARTSEKQSGNVSERKRWMTDFRPMPALPRVMKTHNLVQVSKTSRYGRRQTDTLLRCFS